MQTKFRPIVVDKTQLLERAKSLSDDTPQAPIIKPTPIAPTPTLLIPKAVKVKPNLPKFVNTVVAQVVKPVPLQNALHISFEEDFPVNLTIDAEHEDLTLLQDTSTQDQALGYSHDVLTNSVLSVGDEQDSDKDTGSISDAEEQVFAGSQDLTDEESDSSERLAESLANSSAESSEGLDNIYNAPHATTSVPTEEASSQPSEVSKKYVPTPRPTNFDLTPRSLADDGSGTSSFDEDRPALVEEETDPITLENSDLTLASKENLDSPLHSQDSQFSLRRSSLTEFETKGGTTSSHRDALDNIMHRKTTGNSDVEESRSSGGLKLCSQSLATLQNEENDDEYAIFTPKMKKPSSGNKLSLRRFERKRDDEEDMVGGSENPWFEDKSGQKEGKSKEEALPTTPLSQRRRDKLRKLGRIFRKHNAEYIDDDFADPRSSSSTGSLSVNSSLTGSISTNSSARGMSNISAPDVLHLRLEQTIKRAISGKEKLESVMDCLLLLTSRPNEVVLKLLYKYMSSSHTIDYMLKVILDKDNTANGDVALTRMNVSQVGGNLPYRDLLVHVIMNASTRLKRAVLLHGKARSEMLRFFTEERPRGGEKELVAWVATSNAVCKLLNCLLREFPNELTDYVGSKKGFIRLLVKNHIHVPEVMSFVVQLCAADALTNTGGEELRYGSVNASGILVLAKEEVCDVLVDLFVECCNSLMKNESDVLLWQIQVMSMKCLQELCQRALVTPKFNKRNCGYGSRYIKGLNVGLEYLNVFTSIELVERVVEAALGALGAELGICASGTKAERNNGLTCVLSLISGLLGMIRRGSQSKLTVTRRTVGSVDATGMERMILYYTEDLCKLLKGKCNADVGGRVRIGIIEVMRHMYSSKNKDTWFTMSKKRIAERLLITMKEKSGCSIVEEKVVQCLSTALQNDQAVTLHMSWIWSIADHWLDDMKKFLAENGEKILQQDEAFDSGLLQIGYIVMEYSKEDKERKLKGILDKGMSLNEYVDGVEKVLEKIKENCDKSCGGKRPEGHTVSVLADAKSLAARLNDVNAV